uniref:Uncharacterized protein n=1 Tax=Medicago truncatula TaxID=3880 RepID=I3S1J9_MEDTR|nr:unknown [Medicago truncatula]
MSNSSPTIGAVCNRIVIIGTPLQPLMIQHAGMGIIGPNTAVINRHCNRSSTVACLQAPDTVD